MKIIIKALMLLSISLNAYAWKNVGGGNGVGDTLLDVSSPDSSTELNGLYLYNLLTTELSKPLEEIPYLRNMAFYYFVSGGKKSWYLEDRELNPACINQTTVQANKEIWACQNAIETRISRKAWNRISDSTKANLLLHEILTAMRGDTDDRFETVHPAMRILLSDQSAEDKRLNLADASFPLFPLAEEIKLSGELFGRFMSTLCQVRTKTQAILKANDLILEGKNSLSLTLAYLNAGNAALAAIHDQWIEGAGICPTNMTPTYAESFVWETWNKTWREKITR